MLGADEPIGGEGLERMSDAYAKLRDASSGKNLRGARPVVPARCSSARAIGTGREA